MSRQPIDPKNIRKGDLIRKEYGREIVNGETALEYRATSDAHGKGGPGQHFLIERPTPPLELPTEPTLGTVDWAGQDGEPRHETALWWQETADQIRSESTGLPTRFVTAFTPILTHADDETAVPTAALDALRSANDEACVVRGERGKNDIRRNAIVDFLCEIEATR